MSNHPSPRDFVDFMYQEAFLTTYRTFVSPHELIDKLLYRYNRFAHKREMSKKRLSRNAFSLLVRVVDELTYVESDIASRPTAVSLV